ncbi:hypothetical protein BH09BAC1_BH09BAC1_18500 [soil metagenome]
MDAFFGTLGMYGIILSYILLLIASVGFIGFELYHIATNFRESKFQLAGVGALALILGIAWVLGSGDYTFPGIEQYGMTESSIRLVDMGLIATYLLVAVAVVGLVADIILGTLKK